MFEDAKPEVPTVDIQSLKCEEGNTQGREDESKEAPPAPVSSFASYINHVFTVTLLLLKSDFKSRKVKLKFFFFFKRN